ncbi:autotransporter domain-containing protein [Neisseriaceae bacterium TC5R-5]|nr:autotransporter domain-containing protein [Neisseriaceae bacterium TC5R-5]
MSNKITSTPSFKRKAIWSCILGGLMLAHVPEASAAFNYGLCTRTSDPGGDCLTTFTGAGGVAEMAGSSTTDRWFVIKDVRGTIKITNDNVFSIINPCTFGDYENCAAISGPGQLAKSGTGTLVLDSANTYSGGTLIQEGTIRVSADNNLGDISGAINFAGGKLQVTNSFETLRNVTLLNAGGTIEVTSDNVFSIASPFGVIGDGKLSKSGTGTLVLDSANTYSGGTLIQEGTIRVSADNNLGDLSGAISFNGGKLQVTNAFDTPRNLSVQSGGGTIQIDDGHLAMGALMGSGNLTKTGAGDFTLNGFSDLNGDVTVNGGQFAARGRLGSLTLNSVSQLAIAGSGINTLEIDGSVNLNNLTYRVNVNSLEQSDLLKVGGLATISNSVVYANLLGNTPVDYTKNTYTYKILSAAGGVNGKFVGLNDTYPLLDLALDYDANNVYLTVSREAAGKPINNLADTDNQKNSGKALDDKGGGNALNDAITNLSNADQIRNALDLISGELYASVKSSLIEDNHFIRDAANDRLRSSSGNVGAGEKSYNAKGEKIAANSPDRVFWTRAFGAAGSIDGNSNAAKMNRDISGFLMGSDAQFSDWRVGALSGYSRSTMETSARNSSGSSDNYHLGVYAGTQFEKILFRSGLIYNLHKLDIERDVKFPGFSDAVSSNYKANSLQVFGELAKPQKWAGIDAEPYLNLTHINLHTNEFTEAGQLAALNVDSQNSNVTFTTLGVRAVKPFNEKMTINGQIGWRHAFGDTTSKSTQSLVGSSKFTAAGTPIAKDTAVFELGADMQLSKKTSVSLVYSGLYSNNSRENAVTAHLNWLF